MTSTPPRRSLRIPHIHTPKMSERKKGLFQEVLVSAMDSLTKHRRPAVVDSESDSEDCDLGIISTLDTSSSDEMCDQSVPKTPEKDVWYETRSRTAKIFKENCQLKNFIKSPFTLKQYQTRNSSQDKRTSSSSTPATPHLHNHPGTPSSTHSSASAHTSSSEHSKARKSLASLIADTESCSSSLKDLNFNSDSENDSKENTPSTLGVRKSGRKLKMTPKFASFKGVLIEQRNNQTSPVTKLNKSNVSPTQMLKTPQNTPETPMSPPKIGYHRRSAISIAESPEEDFEKNHKRLRNNSISSDGVPSPKYLKLDSSTAPKARLSLFNTDKLKEFLSAKSFYGKVNVELEPKVTTMIANTMLASTSQTRRVHGLSHSHRRRTRKPGQINWGVRHRIRKPKVHSKGRVIAIKPDESKSNLNKTSMTETSGLRSNNNSMLNQSFSHVDIDNEKADPFDNEKQTIEALLNQWTEEDVGDELKVNKAKTNDLVCFNKDVMEESHPMFSPVSAVPVENTEMIEQDIEPVIVDLEASDHSTMHGELRNGLLPVDGGYIIVNDKSGQVDEELPDLDEIEREIRMLDEQILKMAESNNINAEAVLASTETRAVANSENNKTEPVKLFPVFNKSTPAPSTATNRVSLERSAKKNKLKKITNQYVIDAGQKRFGATQCTECGVIYEIGNPQDEHDHLVHHNATDVLRFNGWKEECVVGAWGDVGGGGGRCVRVRGAEGGWRRVHTLLERLVHPQLGHSGDLPGKLYTYIAYLYIERKQIVGCLIAEPKLKAYKMIPGDPDCCSLEEYPVKCGVSRIWTHVSHRRMGVARRLLDCMRTSFLYDRSLLTEEIAFSAPTEAATDQ